MPQFESLFVRAPVQHLFSTTSHQRDDGGLAVFLLKASLAVTIPKENGAVVKLEDI
jgi:hypothetical protein